MPKPTGPTNPVLKELIQDLRSNGYKNNSKFLINLADRLEKSRRSKPAVNLSKLERYCNENETVIVPGKVLSDGLLTKPLTIAAINFSETAKEKIRKAGGKIITIKQLVEKNPKGSGTKIIT